MPGSLAAMSYHLCYSGLQSFFTNCKDTLFIVPCVGSSKNEKQEIDALNSLVLFSEYDLTFSFIVLVATRCHVVISDYTEVAEKGEQVFFVHSVFSRVRSWNF